MTTNSKIVSYDAFNVNEAKGKPDTDTKELQELPATVKVADVVAAYSGKPHQCMCGCSGKYYYQKSTQKTASTNRGYKVGDDEIDEAKVNFVFNKVKANAPKVGVNVIKDYIYTVYVGNKQYTIYLAEPKDAGANAIVKPRVIDADKFKKDFEKTSGEKW